MFIFMFVFFLGLLAVLVNNVIVWWSVFLLMTLLFVLLNKGMMSYSSMFNYFILQESLGLMFLLLTIGYMQLLILMLKIGVAPLHFWIFSVINSVSGFNLMWFLTFQKLPFLVVLLQFMNSMMIIFLLLGLVACMIQMVMTKSFKNLLVLSSTESFNWVLLSFILSFLSVIVLFLYYFVLMVYLIPKFENVSFGGCLGWETVLVFMNLPFSINFFVKIFALAELVMNFSLIILLIMFMMFLSVLSLGFWLISLSTKDFWYLKFSKLVWGYCLCFMLLLVY